MTGVDRSPSRVSGALSIAAAVVGVFAHGVPVGAAAGALGLPLLAHGVLRGSRGTVTIGALAVFAGVVLAGLARATPAGLLVGTVAAVLAWDFGEQAINVGEQLGAEASTGRGEFAHAASSTVVGVLSAGVGYAIYLVAAGGQPLAALVLLLAAALAFAASLRD